MFLFVEPLAGRRRVRVTEHRAGVDFAHQMKHWCDVEYPDAEVIRVVLDNLNTHGPGSLWAAFEPEEAWRLVRRLEFHYTPQHASWLNRAELELRVLARQCLDRRIGDIETLAREVGAWTTSQPRVSSVSQQLSRIAPSSLFASGPIRPRSDTTWTPTALPQPVICLMALQASSTETPSLRSAFASERIVTRGLPSFVCATRMRTTRYSASAGPASTRPTARGRTIFIATLRCKGPVPCRG
ncbi:MAG: transposase [Planctomycetes bacterium]|nr:transposase [Planctomycetota bacterium]